MTEHISPAEAAREAELEKQVDAEMERLGLDKLTFSHETVEADWEKLLDYYGHDVLANAINIYDLKKVLDKYAPGHKVGEMHKERLEKLKDVFRYQTNERDTRGNYTERYVRPFLIPYEFRPDITSISWLLGKDTIDELTNEKSGYSEPQEPIFLFPDRYPEVIDRLYKVAMDNLCTPRGKEGHIEGETWGPKFIKSLRRRIKKDLETKRDFPETKDPYDRWEKNISEKIMGTVF